MTQTTGLIPDELLANVKKEVSVLFIFGCFLLTACTVSSYPPPTPTIEPTPTPTSPYVPRPLNYATPTPAPTAAIHVTCSTETARELARTNPSFVHQVAWSPDSQNLAVADLNGIYLYEMDTLQETLFIPSRSGIARLGLRAMAFSPNGRRLASGGQDATVRIWDVSTGKLLQTLEGHTYPVTYVVYSHDGNRLASTTHGVYYNIKIWDARTGTALETLMDGSEYDLDTLAFSADDTQLITSNRWEREAAWKKLDNETGSFFSHSFSPDWGVYSALSPDGSLMGVWCPHGDIVNVWDTTTERLLHSFDIPYNYQAACAPSGRRGRGPGLSRGGGYNNILNVIISQDNRLLALKRWDMTVVIDIGTGKTRVFEEKNDLNAILSVSPDGRWLASTNEDGIVRLWPTQ